MLTVDSEELPGSMVAGDRRQLVKARHRFTARILGTLFRSCHRRAACAACACSGAGSDGDVLRDVRPDYVGGSELLRR